MPQDRSNLATYGNRDVKSLVERFRNDLIDLTEKEETSIISMWPALRPRLVIRQKGISPTHVFSDVNLLASRPYDIKACLLSLGVMLTSTPSTAKCKPGFSAMNHLKCNLRTTLVQNTLSDLMQMHSSDHAMKAYRPNSAISNWFSGPKTNRHILIFKLTTGTPKLSANLLMMFIVGTSFMLAVQTKNWNTSYNSPFNCFIVSTFGKLLQASSNINWQRFRSQRLYLDHKTVFKNLIHRTLKKNATASSSGQVSKLVLFLTVLSLLPVTTSLEQTKRHKSHSVDIQIDYRHSQTISKFVDDVHSRNLIHVGSTSKDYCNFYF